MKVTNEVTFHKGVQRERLPQWNFVDIDDEITIGLLLLSKK